MIQFLGLHLNAEAASVEILGRDLEVSARFTTPMVNTVKDSLTGRIEVPTAEWVRAGAYALQEAYFKLPVKLRKAWGMGLAGPSGWVALDVEFEPITPLCIAPEGGSNTGAASRASVAEAIARWAKENPRLARKVSVVLSPKDYFRFELSKGLAADVTAASRLGILKPGKSQWSEDLAAEIGIPISWLPPVFDCHVMTGRLSEEGIRRTSLPGGFWLVAGAHEDEAAILAAGDQRDGCLRAVLREEGRAILALGVPHLELVEPPAGWYVRRSALHGHQVLERECETPAQEALAGGRVELESAGFKVRGLKEATASPASGAAALAAVGSGLVHGFDKYYQSRNRG